MGRRPACPERPRRRDAGTLRAPWKTPEREAALVDNWPTHSIPQLAALIAGLEGPALPQAAIQVVGMWGRSLGLRKTRERPPAPPPAPPAAMFAGERKPEGRGEAIWKTDERRLLLLEHWSTHSARELAAMLAAEPGPPLPATAVMRVHQWAMSLNLPRKTPEQWRVVMLRGQAAHRGYVAEAAPATARLVPAAVRAGDPARRSFVVTWAQALAWADTRDPDLVLRGSRADRLAQINELRRLEEMGPFRLAEAEAA